MTPEELKSHYQATKRLAKFPSFHATKSRQHRLPAPFHKSMKGPRIHASGEIPLSDVHVAFFFWRDGNVFTDAAFFAWLMHKQPNQHLYPLLEYHYHPSHKGLHVKLPCKTSTDYTDRMLPNAPELNVHLPANTDPRKPEGRHILIHRFCEICGIQMGEGFDLWH
jgi:hypothetical protein